jgi:hypothetical protein
VASPSALLDAWLGARLAPAASEWLGSRVAAATAGGADAAFLLAFGMAPRKVGKAALALGGAEVLAADQARRGWQPALWSADQAARSRLVLALPIAAPGIYRATLDRLFDESDLGELVALYQTLPLLPFPAEHRARAAEGIRSNMTPVFEAIALRNPYPAESLDESAWNQLVLKCVFVGAPLHLVHGVDGRVNAALAGMLCDLAHERWAANRPFSPELWRSVGPVASGRMLADLERVLATGSDVERAAVALSARHNPEAEGVLDGHSAAIDRALAAYGTWEAVARA